MVKHLLLSISFFFVLFWSAAVFGYSGLEAPFEAEIPGDWALTGNENIIHLDLPGEKGRLSAAILTFSRAVLPKDIYPACVAEAFLESSTPGNPEKDPKLAQAMNQIRAMREAHWSAGFVKKTWKTSFRLVGFEPANVPSKKVLALLGSYSADVRGKVEEVIRRAVPKPIPLPFSLLPPKGWRFTSGQQGKIKTYTYLEPNDNAKLCVYILPVKAGTKNFELERLVRGRLFHGFREKAKSEREIEGLRGRQFSLRGRIGAVGCNVLGFAGVFDAFGYVVYYQYCDSVNRFDNDRGLASYRSFRLGGPPARGTIPAEDGVSMTGPEGWVFSKEKSRDRGNNYDSYTFMEESGLAAVGIYVFPSGEETSGENFLRNFGRVYAEGLAQSEKHKYVLNLLDGLLVVYKGRLNGRDMEMRVFVYETRFEVFAAFMFCPTEDKTLYATGEKSWMTFNIKDRKHDE